MQRQEAEMLALIVQVAADNPAIRATVLQGSRANPAVSKDALQDYDVLYLVENVEKLINDHRWIDVFGERLILQMPETMTLPAPSGTGNFSYLMLFTDGNRIDLTLMPVSKWERRGRLDSLSVLLLDKDDRFSQLPAPSERDYYLESPEQKTFSDCCNEFWWTMTYVAKGLRRSQIVYAKSVQEKVVRSMLDQMIRWYIGAVHGLDVNPGQYGKFFQHYLSVEEWQWLLATYSDASLPGTWQAMLRMAELFEYLSLRVAEHFGFSFPTTETPNVRSYLSEQFRKTPFAAS